ncbi:hypothetical protein BTH160X_300021 [Brochothrix thermosphacta]|uniref:bifunctional DNA primase/polymerase n=1 Tax=Brochothrix thermosphacta TaxID=2756 RepID=UPI000D0E4AD1|nr:bifunctional DNA primase/polymerase [Brochothrix thermosphacta]SOC27467.1 hypothetical protein BTH160X_300021 [Brochothrix thermosphacta]
MNLQQMALKYAQKGVSVFPCVQNEKRPATSNGFKSASMDQQQILDWWKTNPNYNIGIPTGETMWVLDIDVHGSNEGMEQLKEWESNYGQVQTTTVQTPTGGLHYYFSGTQFLPTSSTSKLAPQVDIKGKGGYVLAPPSIHPNGGTYEVLNSHPIVEAPEWLKTLIRNSEGQQKRKLSSDEWGELLSGVNVGERNNTLARLAGRYLYKLGSHETYEILKMWNANLANPLAISELNKTFSSILKREIKKQGAWKNGNKYYSTK